MQQLFTRWSLSLLVTALLLGNKASGCPSGDWYSYDGFCYKLFNRCLAWNDAEMFCINLDSDCYLASVQNKIQSADLADYVSRNIDLFGNVWIGLRDPLKNRAWQWTDGSQTSYTAWNRGEPNNMWNNEYCVELWAWSGYMRWNDQNCKSKRAFLCKCKF